MNRLEHERRLLEGMGLEKQYNWSGYFIQMGMMFAAGLIFLGIIV